MKYYYKIIQNDIIIGVLENDEVLEGEDFIQISKEEFDEING